MSIVSKVRLSSIFLPLAAVVSHSSLAMAQTGGGVPAPSVAPDNHSVLILSSTVVPDPLDPLGRSIEQIQAEAAGFTVVIGGAGSFDPNFWDAQDYSSYRAIILGDPSCSEDVSVLAAAERTKDFWGPKITGNVVIAGNSPAYQVIALSRRDEATAFIRSAIELAAARPGQTGAYISLSCYYLYEPPDTTVDILSPFAGSNPFLASGGCWDDAHQVASHPSMSTLDDPTMSYWGCSANNTFSDFPNGQFAPVWINYDAGEPGSLYFPDGSAGVPYVVARGVTPLGCGDGIVDGNEECDDGNTSECDGCSAQCRLECGDGIVACTEQCDDGNHLPDDGCNDTCGIEGCGNGVVEPGEQCDDGNTNTCDGCTATCQLECGNGTVECAEECDDGNTTAGDDCSSVCQEEVCGNGILDPGEQCDDGNSDDNDDCKNDCTGGNLPPTSLCNDVSVDADAQCKASADIDAGSFDPNGDSFTCTPAPAGPYSPPTTSVTLTCTDIKGAQSSCTGIVTVVDVTPPVFTFVPGPITISTCINANIGTATANDNCGSVTVTNNAPAKFPLGTTTVTWTAVDASGHATTATQAVTAVLGDDESCCPTGTNIIPGSNASETIVGTQGSDCILGRGGDDTIDAYGGVDYVSGGSGRDTIYTGSGSDWLWGGIGDDVLDSGDHDDHIFGGSGNDTIMAGNGTDVLEGGPGTDTCSWGPSAGDVITSCEVTF